jgi:hypothetical protein
LFDGGLDLALRAIYRQSQPGARSEGGVCAKFQDDVYVEFQVIPAFWDWFDPAFPSSNGFSSATVEPYQTSRGRITARQDCDFHVGAEAVSLAVACVAISRILLKPAGGF